MKRIFRAFFLAAIFLNGAVVARADALDHWTSVQLSTNSLTGYGLQLLGVAYGNGRYVAVGQYAGDDAGVVETSEDGVNWTLRTTHDYSVLDLFDVTYCNSTFVAVGWDWFGGNNLYHSTNGTDWTPHPSAIANFYGVTYGGGLFVAVGDGTLLQSSSTTNRNIYTSPDGTNWTARNSGAPRTDVHDIKDVVYGGDRFAAIDNVGYVYTSTTGVAWTRNLVGNNPAISSYGFINYCNGLFIALVNTGTNLISADGLSWSVMVKDITNALSRVFYTNGLYLALSGSTIFTSTNGTNWVQRNLPAPTNATLSDVSFGDRNVVIAGYKGTSVPVLPVAYVSDPFVALGVNSAFPPQLTVSGLAGRSYRIEHLTNLLSNDWQTLTTFELTNSPYIWTDAQATNSQRYYRAVLLP